MLITCLSIGSLESDQKKTYKTKRNRVDVGLKKRGECDILVGLRN